MQDDFILTINAGSSSLKFALFRAGVELSRELTGQFDRIGSPDGTFTVKELLTGNATERPMQTPDHAACVPLLVERLAVVHGARGLRAIGHRVVHGGPRYRQAQRVDTPMLLELRRIIPLNPQHLPYQIGLIEELARRYPEIPQIACFDTAFHNTMPRVARLLPIPRKYDAQGVQRYGFHGLSYAFLMRRLQEIAGEQAANGRVILAHLGHGASMAAVRDGRCIDTTMAFTPAAGLVMSTRSGDLDPGLVGYFAEFEGMSAEQFSRMTSKQSGLLGVSETSSDVRDLLAREQTDVRAAEALELFCYQARKWIGALTAALGGLDTLVFSGGIGEHRAVIRERICRGLEHLGIELDPELNRDNAPLIARSGSKAAVRIIRTDEELQIAQTVQALLAGASAPASVPPAKLHEPAR